MQTTSCEDAFRLFREGKWTWKACQKLRQRTGMRCIYESTDDARFRRVLLDDDLNKEMFEALMKMPRTKNDPSPLAKLAWHEYGPTLELDHLSTDLKYSDSPQRYCDSLLACISLANRNRTQNAYDVIHPHVHNARIPTRKTIRLREPSKPRRDDGIASSLRVRLEHYLYALYNLRCVIVDDEVLLLRDTHLVASMKFELSRASSILKNDKDKRASTSDPLILTSDVGLKMNISPYCSATDESRWLHITTYYIAHSIAACEPLNPDVREVLLRFMIVYADIRVGECGNILIHVKMQNDTDTEANTENEASSSIENPQNATARTPMHPFIDAVGLHANLKFQRLFAMRPNMSTEFSVFSQQRMFYVFDPQKRAKVLRNAMFRPSIKCEPESRKGTAQAQAQAQVRDERRPQTRTDAYVRTLLDDMTSRSLKTIDTALRDTTLSGGCMHPACRHSS